MTDEHKATTVGTQSGTDGEVAVSLFDSEGQFVRVDQRSQELHRRDEEELLGLSLQDVLADPSFEHGRLMEQVLNGEAVEGTVEVVRGDGTTAMFWCEVGAVMINGETHARSRYGVIEETEDSTPVLGVPDESVFDNIDGAELEDISQNIRVDAPDGEMPLNAIMLDLTVGHNEIEQYKKGALTLYKCLDERLKEEEKRNPDSKEVDVLREVKKSAFGLYLRIQRGDEELHGQRDGKYSGYFN